METNQTPITTPASPAASCGVTALPLRPCGDSAASRTVGGGRRAAVDLAPAAG